MLLKTILTFICLKAIYNLSTWTQREITFYFFITDLHKLVIRRHQKVKIAIIPLETTRNYTVSNQDRLKTKK